MRVSSRKNFSSKIAQLVSKFIIVIASGVICLWIVSGARAAESKLVSVKGERVNNQKSAVKIQFNKKLSSNDIAVFLDRNFIQFSVEGVSAYPARTEKYIDNNINRVFSYQFNPAQARVRVYLKSKADNIRDRYSWKLVDNTIILEVHDDGLNIAKKSTKNILETSKDRVINRTASLSKKKLNAEESALLNELMKDAKAGVKRKTQAGGILAKDAKKSETTKNGIEALDKKEASTGISFVTMIVNLLGVLAFFIFGAFVYKKYVLKKGLSFTAKSNNMIDVVSSHILGPKKTLSVVKIGNELIVLGISGDNINFITKLDDQAVSKEYEAAPVVKSKAESDFGDILSGTVGRNDLVEFNEPQDINMEQLVAASNESSVRDKIKSKLQNFKRL